MRRREGGREREREGGRETEKEGEEEEEEGLEDGSLLTLEMFFSKDCLSQITLPLSHPSLIPLSSLSLSPLSE